MRAAGLTVLVLSMGIAHADPVDTATDVANSMNDYLGSAGAIEQNLSGPLLSDQAMTGPDGRPFGAQIGCPTAAPFLEVFIAPGAGGDITTLNIQQDTTMSGAFDHLLSAPFPVSGVCANGVVSCTPGTWEGCNHYRWAASGANELMLELVPLRDLGGCYCVNNACGTNLVMANLERTVTDLGSGAAAALARQNAYYAISDVTVTGPVATYSGQDTGACTGPAPPMAEYYADPASIVPDAFATAAVDEIYQDMISSPAAEPSAGTTISSCNVTRSVTMNESGLMDIIDFDSGSGSVVPCGPACLSITLGVVGDNYWSASPCGIFTHYAGLNVLEPARIVSATLNSAVWDDWIQVWGNDDLIWFGPYAWTSPTANPPGPCELGTSWSTSPGVEFTDVLTVGGPVDFDVRVAVAGGGEGYVQATVEVDTSCQLDPDVIVDSCSGFHAAPDCTLIEEVVDGVVTYSGYASTSLTPLPQTVTVSGSVCSADVTRDWFVKQRKYACIGTAPFDFADALERQAHVVASASAAGYEDRITDLTTGEVTYSAGALPLFTDVDVQACAPVCKTRREVTQDNVSASGLVQDNTATPVSYDIAYRACSATGCPLSPGEEIVTDCTCLDAFAEAATVMQLIRSAGRDILCSSGTHQSP